MNRKGQASIEAVIAFCAFLAFLGIALAAVSMQEKQAEKSALSISERIEGINCAIALNSLYSNSVESEGIEFDCDACGQQSVCCGSKKLKIIPKVKTVRISDKSILEAENEDHYL